jgi:UDP-N-acetylmuramyl pentapeptide phosphotransferase/UDP-N-acetylglucosamine-1-phosphate transferase
MVSTTISDWLPIALAALASAVASAWLPRIARARGWADGGDEIRKRQERPIALSGGAAILAGIAAGSAAAWLTGALDGELALGREVSAVLTRWLGIDVRVAPVAALLTAFAVGLADDLSQRGLSARAKLAGQLACGLALCAPTLAGGAPLDDKALVATLAMLAAATALNAVNTFDNADGAASGLAAAALAIPAPLAAAPIVAFLPFNLWGRAEGRKSILGDAGSHLLGMLIVLTPAAWPALALPLFDLGRLAVVRFRLGVRPWVGDRRHLAHRLLDRGLSPRAAALALALIAAPSVALGWAAARGLADPAVGAVGIVATAACAAAALRFAPVAVCEPSRLRCGERPRLGSDS